jgi:hypothetical protein
MSTAVILVITRPETFWIARQTTTFLMPSIHYVLGLVLTTTRNTRCKHIFPRIIPNTKQGVWACPLAFTTIRTHLGILPHLTQFILAVVTHKIHHIMATMVSSLFFHTTQRRRCGTTLLPDLCLKISRGRLKVCYHRIVSQVRSKQRRRPLPSASRTKPPFPSSFQIPSRQVHGLLSMLWTLNLDAKM